MTQAPTLNGQVIGQAERATRAVLDVLLAEASTPFVDWVCINVLATQGEMTPDALAARLVSGLRIAESDARASIDHIARTGLATGGDTLDLTSDGQARYELISTGIAGISHRLYDDLPVEDLVTARRVLETLTDRARAELDGIRH